LILLAKVGQLDLLHAGVPEIIVPDVVLREVGARGPADPVFQEVQRATWLKMVPAPPIPPRVLVWSLGAGESSVLAAALTDPDCEAILDDRHARRCAQALKNRSPWDTRPDHPGKANRFDFLGTSRSRERAAGRAVPD
jgi:predicted nucleic acid-binding protein